MREEDGAISIDVDEGSCLVQVLQAKGYAVFGGNHGHASLQPPVGPVVLCVCMCTCIN